MATPCTCTCIIPAAISTNYANMSKNGGGGRKRERD